MLVSCQKGTNDINTIENQGVFTVTADYVEPVADVTKTAFVDDENPYVKWLSTDKIIVYESIDGEYKYHHNQKGDIILSDNDKQAKFNISLYTPTGVVPTGNTFCYTAIYPATGVNEGTGFYYFEIPASQTLSEDGNFASNADILIGKPINMNSRISTTTNLEVQFKRPGTVVALTLKGITAGETISSVKVTAPEGKKIAGRCKIDLITGVVPEDEKAYYGGTNEITLNCNITATGNDKFYFRCLDGTWTSGSEVSINVETDKAYYSKTVNLPNDYIFADGGLTKFGFQFSETHREAKSNGTPYTLVTSNSDICDGASYIFVGIKDDMYYAMSEQNSNNRKSTVVSVPVDNVISLPTSTEAYTFQLEEKTEGWAIKDNTASSVNKGEYLYPATGGNYLRSQENVLAWTIDIDEQNCATISANEKLMRCNTNQTPLFACYSSGQSPIYLYVDKSTCKEKLATPVLGTPTVNHFTKSITITWTDVANATVYEVSCGEQKQNINPGVQTHTFNELSAGDYTITVKAVDGTDTYTSATATTGKITLGDPTITLSTTEVVNVAAEGGDFEDITYELNYAEDKDLSWTCDGTVVTKVVVVADGGKIVYSVSENAANEGRNGEIKVTLNGETKTITISQLGKGAAPDPVLTKLKDISDVPAAGVTGVTESEVYSLENAEVGDLTITPDGEIVTAASSTTLGSITYTVAANTGEARTGSITISIGSTESIEISVSQLTGVSHDYKLVESSLTDWRGDYLIAYSDDVFMDGSLAGGTNGVGKTQSHVAPANNLSSDKKTVSESWGDTHYVTIEAINDTDLSKGYVIKSHSQTTPYFYQTSNKNGMTSTATKATAAKYPITIEFTSSSDIKIKLGGEAAGAVLRYNKTNGTTGEMFRFYKNCGQYAIYLYKKQ
ncbi:MAG: hypothetical protein KBS95_08250 [Alistipes sp.]|nr:hypothetical protein [Candidatus Alistipes equi]